MTISSWLNFGRPAPPGRGSAAGQNFFGLALLQPACSVCISLSAFSFCTCNYCLGCAKLRWDRHHQCTTGIEFYTCQMPFLPLQQQCWNTAGKSLPHVKLICITLHAIYSVTDGHITEIHFFGVFYRNLRNPISLTDLQLCLPQAPLPTSGLTKSKLITWSKCCYSHFICRKSSEIVRL